MSEVHNASPHADLESSDIQDLAKLMRRQLRQFAQFVRSEARILSTMPELLFQRCTHCINESAPQSIGTYLLESGAGRTSYCRWMNKPLSQQKLAESDQHEQVSCLAWSSDSSMCAFGLMDGKVRILDIPSMQCVQVLSEAAARKKARKSRSASATAFASSSNNPSVSAMAFARHHGWLAVGNINGHIVIWDTTSAMKIVTRVEVHAASISGLSFNRDSKFLASSSSDTTLRIFHTGTGTFDEIARIAGRLSILHVFISFERMTEYSRKINAIIT